MEAWDRRGADTRSAETMRRVAREARQLADQELYGYAEENQLSVDEVVTYLNAYEAGATQARMDT